MNILKTALGTATLIVASSSAYATDLVDLGELHTGINTYTQTVGADSTFTNTFTFSLADVSTGTFSLNDLSLTNGDVNVLGFSDLSFSLYNSSDTWLAGSVAAGEFTFANLEAGNYYINVEGTTNGVAGGVYSGAINIQAVPEPGSYALLGIGLAVIGVVATRRRKNLS
ncbi:FxDxF family PEP-CTERM protein [Methylobacillus gramineus]|uniref:FxDxF family PEP-CTERM protein n=1 Tax=Methylobacillus gramineus TaxID=755169 RepID=UPI001CFFA920|nr:FxDxF family PEP-CTERM protein [Methylobacillus gramineus]MCB5184002.1 FxDxF family PEP-CTERM protein [Methylobacillus gramineus]